MSLAAPQSQEPPAVLPGDAFTEYAVSHLRPSTWAHVNRMQVRKMIAELAHERLIAPYLRDAATGEYAVQTDDPEVHYRFVARRMHLNHWNIDVASIARVSGERVAALSVTQLVLDLRSTLGIDPGMLPTYLEEISGTLYSAAYKHEAQRLTARELARADFQLIESSMSEGHPCFIANNGRIGFDAEDFRAYAPEAGAPLAVVWLAAHRQRAGFSCVDGLNYLSLVMDELGPMYGRFVARLEAQGLPPDDYIFMPIHPWQWSNKLVMAFAGEIATGFLVYLGHSEDRYLPQQSIRTLFNVTQPLRCYVKTSLSILNMGFVRGLSPYYMAGTPAINEWVDQQLRSDDYLQQHGFEILREVASVGYRNPFYEAGAQAGSPYHKLLAALWRESPLRKIAKGQQLMTMAALLHHDRDGASLLSALIESSGLGVDAWLQRYFRAYFIPLLHCFYAHDLVFMPHGENLILVLEGGVPVRAFIKDIAEEVAVFDNHGVLPQAVQRIAVHVPEDVRLLSIFTDVFDNFFRFLAEILCEQCDCPEERFWELVACSVLDYQREQPRLQAKFQRFDMFTPAFKHSCLNRLQLRNNRQLIDLANPAAGLQFAGMLDNPIAPHKLKSS